MVEMEVAHRDQVDGLRLEAGRLHRGHDRGALVAAHLPGLLGEPLADPGLDEHATRRRLDEQAVQRLEEPVLVVDLVGHEAVPEQPRHRPEQRAGIGAEGAGLDQRDARPAAEIGDQSTASFIGIVRALTLSVVSRRRRSRGGRPRPWAPTGLVASSRRAASAVRPFHRLLIREQQIWPIFMQEQGDRRL